MRQFALVGKTLGHSFSRAYFTDKFRRENIAAEFINLPLPDIKDIPKTLEEHPLLEAFSVTIPYKESIIPYIHRLSPAAQAIGAVNSVKIIREQNGLKLLGYNTDYLGFWESFAPQKKEHHRQALILGSGGASKAVAYAFKINKIPYKIVSRKAHEHLNDCLTYCDLESIIGNYQLIVNTTPLGTSPDINTCPDIPYHLIGEQHYCFDLVYNPVKTNFLSRSEQAGAEIKNGLEMLHLQAEESWKIWNATSCPE